MPVRPRIAKLTNACAQQFALVDNNGNPVAVAAWTINPAGVGLIDPDGTYTAPDGIAAAAQVTVTATPAAGNPATATVELVPAEVILTPAAVKLRAGERQQFAAVVPGDPNNRVQWTFAPTLDVPPGAEYRAPDAIAQNQEVVVTATSIADPHKSAHATVTLLSKPPQPAWTFSLTVYLMAIFSLVFLLIRLWPPGLYDRTQLETKRTARMADETAERQAIAAQNDAQAALTRSPADQALQKKLADTTAAAQKAAQVLKQALDDEQSEAEKQRQSEETPVWVPLGSASREVNLLWLVVVAGALGSFVYSTRSFVDFVGNRMVRASWSVWYIMYPLIGAALALIFYLVIRGGFLTAATKDSDINVYGLVAIAGMVGMFSKQATNKLDELFSTMFKSEKDDRNLKDKLG